MKNLQYITMPFKLDGFMELDDASFGKGIKDVYRRVHEQERTPLESEGARCLSAHCWGEVQRGMDKADAESQRNAEKGRISAAKRKEQKESTAVNSSQPQSTAVNHSQPNQPTSTESTDKIRKEKNKENTSIAQTEFALDGGSCSEKEEKTCYPFEQFWDDYGNKQDRKKCERLYAKIKEADRQKIQDAIPRYNAFLQATGRNKKDPATWLNNESWNNDYTIPQQPQAQAGASGEAKTFDPSKFNQA